MYDHNNTHGYASTVTFRIDDAKNTITDDDYAAALAAASEATS